MNIRQYRDDGRNFIVIGSEHPIKEDYRYRMLQGNPFSKLLPCRIRDIDTERYLYYETGGLFSLDARFGSEKLKGTEIRRLFTDLQEAFSEIRAHLLSPEGLILTPEYVFRHATEASYCFLYHVGPENCLDERELLAWIKARYDPGDPEAADLMEEMRRLEGMDLETMLGTLLSEDDVAESLTTDDFLFENDFGTEMSAPLWSETMSAFPEEDFSPIQATYGSKEDEERPAGKAGYVIMGVLFAAILIVNVFLRKFYTLTTTESVILAAVGIVCAIMMVISFASLRKKKKPEDALLKELQRADTQDAYGFGTGESEQVYREYEAAYDPKDRYECNSMSFYDEDFDEEGTETVLMSPSQKGEHKLYSRGEGRLIKIDLGKLPLTVGKLPGVADFLLKREEISRLHVRFFCDEGSDTIFMKDLNSTNGTFRNGLRLHAGECVALYPGDEIRLGAMEFEFI